jgi:hypothetical protein
VEQVKERKVVGHSHRVSGRASHIEGGTLAEKGELIPQREERGHSRRERERGGGPLIQRVAVRSHIPEGRGTHTVM